MTSFRIVAYAMRRTIVRSSEEATMKARALAVLVTIGGVGMALPSLGAESEVSYRVRNGAVDESTYLGWRTFHSACHGCHGVDATGTEVAPNLVERVRESGQIVMPAWEGDDRAEPYLIDLYRYLRARGDGALGPGEPRQVAE